MPMQPSPQATSPGDPGRRWIWLWAALGAVSGLLAGHLLADRWVGSLMSRLRPPRIAPKDLPGVPGAPRRTDLHGQHTWELQSTGPAPRVVPLPEGLWTRAGARITGGDEGQCRCALGALPPGGPLALVVITEAEGRGTIALDAATGAVRWRQSVRAWQGAVAAGGRVFVHPGKIDGDPVYALDAPTGRVLWTSPADPAAARGTALGGLVAADEVLYVARSKDPGARFGDEMWVEALRATDGQSLWRSRLPLFAPEQRNVFWAGSVTLAIQGDLVLVSAHGSPRQDRGPGPAFWALDARTGARRWQVTHDWPRLPPLALRRGLGVMGGSGLTRAFDPTSGLVLWARPSAQFASLATGLAEVAGTTLRIVDPRTGQDLRTADLGFAAETVIGADHRLLVTGKDQLAAYHEDGRRLWIQPTPRSDLAVAEDTVIVVTGRTLEARSLTDGSLRWSHQGVEGEPLLLTAGRRP